MYKYVLAVHQLRQTEYNLERILSVFCSEFKLHGTLTAYTDDDSWYQTEYVFFEVDDLIEIQNVSVRLFTLAPSYVTLSILGVFSDEGTLELYVSNNNTADVLYEFKDTYIHNNDIIKLSQALGNHIPSPNDSLKRIQPLVSPVDLDWSKSGCMANLLRKAIVKHIIEYLSIKWTNIDVDGLPIVHPEWGGKKYYIKDLPVGTKFYVNNGNWFGEIVSIDGVNYVKVDNHTSPIEQDKVLWVEVLI